MDIIKETELFQATIQDNEFCGYFICKGLNKFNLIIYKDNKIVGRVLNKNNDLTYFTDYKDEANKLINMLYENF